MTANEQRKGAPGDKASRDCQGSTLPAPRNSPEHAVHLLPSPTKKP